MNLIDFPESNTVIAKDQPQYRRIPAHRVPNDQQGRVAFCWELTPEEIAEVGRTGRIWHQVLTFGDRLQPQLLSVEKPANMEVPLPAPAHVSGCLCREYIGNALKVEDYCPVHGRGQVVGILAGDHRQAQQCARERGLVRRQWFSVDGRDRLMGMRRGSITIWKYGTACEREHFERIVALCRAKELQIIDAPAIAVPPDVVETLKNDWTKHCCPARGCPNTVFEGCFRPDCPAATAGKEQKGG